MQKKVSTPINTLIRPTFTIIRTYHLDHFVENLERHVTTRIKYRSSDNMVVVDVHVVMPKPRQKMSSRMSKPTHPKQSKVSPKQEGDIDNPSIDKQKESTSLKLLEKAIMLKMAWQI
jgi:hypothetical protein